MPAKNQGWELWLLTKGGGGKEQEKELRHEKSIPDLNNPSIPKDTRIAFPANLVTTTPLKIPQADEQTQKNIAKLQLEQNGLLKPDNESWDTFTIDTEIPLITAVTLAQELPEGSRLQREQTYDLAARFYKISDIDQIICKKEQGSWVTIFYKNSNPFYAEQIDSLASLSSQIKALLIQFTIQDIPFHPEKIIIESDPDNETLDQYSVNKLEQEIDLSIKVDLVDSINPIFPNSKDSHRDLKLTPPHVLQDRKKRKRSGKLKLYVLLLLCLYTIGGLILFKQHKQRENQIQQAHNQVAELEPQWIKHQQNLAKLNELDSLLTNQWPLASYEKIVSHLPSDQVLRFQVVEIQASNILIKGVSPNINFINALYPKLKNDPYFSNYRWRMPAPSIDQKTKLWSFTIEALKGETN